MFKKLLQILHIACPHRHTSKPFAAAIASDRSPDWESVGPEGSGGAGHYVVCLDCGQKIAYDWANMRLVH